MDPIRKNRRYTWSDYRRWAGDQRWELIGGEPYAMSNPASRHQIVLLNLAAAFRNHFDGRVGMPMISPFDVKLSETDVVQPDLLVVCDLGKLTETHLEGAPDLVIEILSPSTHLHDRSLKTELYARAGVKELWLVTPYPHSVEVYALHDGRYVLMHVWGAQDTLQSPLFPELEIELQAVFDFPIPPEERIDFVKEGRPAYATAE